MPKTALDRLRTQRRLRQAERQLRRVERRGRRYGMTLDEFEEEKPLVIEILEVLNRPQQSFFQLIEGVQQGQDPGLAMKDAWSALRGKTERIEFSDILRTAGMQDGKLLAVTGFAGAMVLDPLNLVPLGAASKLTKAGRKLLFSTQKGRQIATFVAEATRTKPLLGSGVRNQLHRFFITKPNVKPSDYQDWSRSILKRLSDLKDEGLVTQVGREVTPAGPELAEATVKRIGVGGKEELVSVGQEARELTQNLAVRQAAKTSWKEGRMPHEILADYLHLAKRDADVARRMVSTKMLPAIGAYFRQHVNLLSSGDQKLLPKVAEEIGIKNASARAKKLGPLLEAADDPQKLQEAAAQFRKISSDLEQFEKSSGVVRARLGGAIRAKQADTIAKAEKALATNEPDSIQRVASQIREADFGSHSANMEAYGLADALDEMAKGNLDEAGLRGLMKTMQYMPGEIVQGIGTKGHKPINRLAREALKAEKAGGKMTGVSAWEALTKDIIPREISRGSETIIKRREKGLERLATALDRMPGYVLHFMDDETVERLGGLLLKNPRYAKNLGSVRHTSLLLRKWRDANGVPLSLQEVEGVLKASLEEVDRIGYQHVTKRSWGELWRGRPNEKLKMDEYFGLDAVASLTLRAKATAGAVSKDTFRRKMGQMFGRYEGEGGIDLFRDGRRYSPSVSNYVNTLQETYFGTAAAKSFLKFFDGTQALWKGFGLFPRLAYHSRNEVSDHLLMAMSGFYTKDVEGIPKLLQPFWKLPPDHEAVFDVIRAGKLITHHMTGNVDALANTKIMTKTGEITGDKFIEIMLKEGGIGVGFFWDNLPAAARNEVLMSDAIWEGGKFSARNAGKAMAAAADLRTYIMPSHMPRHPGIRSGLWMARALSDKNRVAMIINRLRKGDDFAEAIAQANRVLYDYTDLTPFETQVMRRVFPFYSWCVPDDCEICTKRGWLTVDELRVGDEALSRDAEGNSEWVPVTEIATFPHQGVLMSLTSSREEYLFTADHRWPVIDQADTYSIRRGYELRSNHRIPRWSIYHGGDESISPREAAIVGWLVTDGYQRTRGGHTEMLIYQSPGKYLDEIVELLGEDGSARAPHPESGVVPVGITGELRKRIQELLPEKDRFYEFVTRLTPDAARACYDAMIHAEGTEQPTFTHFAQNPGVVLDAFQLLAQMVGTVAHAGARGCYVSAKYHNMKCAGKVGHRWYSGRVWCPATKHGTWLMRRNGRVIWTGNTRKNLPAMARGLINAPNKFARLGHAARFVQDPNAPIQPIMSFVAKSPGQGIEREDIPEWTDVPKWMRQSVPFPVRRNQETGDVEFITTKSWLPMAELELGAPRHWGKTAMDMLSPLIRGPLETAIGRNLAFDADITGPSEFMGREMPGRIANALNHIILLGEWDRLNMLQDVGFSTRRLRPETDESFRQKLLRLVSGVKIYPLDTRLARMRNLQPVLERNRRRLALEERARKRERAKERGE